uniref:7TM_GPCR_Srx domain-containing protein n=1 Tax=Parastrongyloides trichosuri TaxID=131310 RepID=A0A0N4ZX91_PARTI
MHPYFQLYYSILDDGWHYSKDYGYWNIAWQMENKTVSIELLIAFILNVIITVRIIYIKKRYEQGIINFLSCFVLEVCWLYMSDWFPPSPFTAAILNYFWILYSGNSTITDIILLKDIRNQIKRIFSCRKIKKISVNVVYNDIQRKITHRPEVVD